MRYTDGFITTIFMLISVYIGATIGLVCGQTVVPTACKTTTKFDGMCVDIRDCETIVMELKMSNGFVKDADANYIRQNRCGDLNRQMVCCVPENRIPSQVTISGQTTTPFPALLKNVIETINTPVKEISRAP